MDRKEKNAMMRSIVNEIKLDSGCCNPDCKWEGEFKPVQLQFHHRDPSTKKYKVAFMVCRNHTLKSIMEEIAKCDVVCGNCHAAMHD